MNIESKLKYNSSESVYRLLDMLISLGFSYVAVFRDEAALERLNFHSRHKNER